MMEKLTDDVNKSISELLNTCHAEECRTLQIVYHLCCRCLSHIQTNHQSPNSAVGKSILAPQNSSESKFSESDINELFLSVKNLDGLLWFVFTHRYGWLDQNNKDSAKDLSRIQLSPRGPKNGFSNLLDVFLKWFLLLKPTTKVITAYIKLITDASHLPVVRNRSVIHVLTWLQNHHHELNQPVTFQCVKGLLLQCITDVWSPIRKVSCSRLGSIVDVLNDEARNELFSELTRICLDPEAPWQAKDGAIAAISSLLCHFLSNKMDSQTHTAMPDVISHNIHNIIFSLVCHSQLTIRETAAKAFSLYISSTTQTETLKTLETVMTLLDSKEKDDEKKAGCCNVDAYKAEGLLSICHFIFKSLPKYQLVTEWCKYWPVLVELLSHPASTVRQSTSNIFKLLVQRSKNNPVLFQLVLECLSKDWIPSLDENCDVISRSQKGSWEGNEGRLFAYESICRYVIKDHVCNIFSSEANQRLKLHWEQNGDDARPTDEAECFAKLASSLEGHSLLSQTKMLDAFYVKIINGENAERIEKIQGNVMKFLCGSSEVQKSEEMNLTSLNFTSCRDLFELMLYQTVECLAHSQWELRRIALQVFPYLAEVIRWYGCDIMLSIWKRIKPTSSDLYKYMALFLLRENVVHAARLQTVLHRASGQWKESAQSREAVKGIVDCVQNNVHRCLTLVENIIKRNCFDRLSVLSAETITVTLLHFEISDDRKTPLGHLVVTFWKNLFCFAHPNSRISQELFDCSANNFTSPHYGYLSCCLVRPDSDTQCARQVEKVFMKKMICSLPAFLRLLSLSDAADCLPMLAHNVGLFVADVSSCKSLLRSLSSEAHFVVEEVLKLTDGDVRRSSLQAIYFTLKELAAVIAMKSFDSQLLQKVLSVYLVMCRPINPTRHLRMIFKSVCARIGDRQRLLSCDLSPRTDQDSDINLFWLDSLNQANGHWSELDCDDSAYPDEDLASVYSECLSLNVSCNSGSFSLAVKSRAGSMRSEDGSSQNGDKENTDDDSEWDSWSDEEEDDCTLMNIFGNFLTQMKNIFGKDASKIFSKEIASLDTEENLLIRKLVGDLQIANS